MKKSIEIAYATEHVARTLRNAREARGLSQRALSARAGIPQSHISKIENGVVDLRVSSLVELARVLDLDLVLVPRKAVSAVHAIVGRSDERTLASVESSRRALNELKQLQDNIALCHAGSTPLRSRVGPNPAPRPRAPTFLDSRRSSRRDPRRGGSGEGLPREHRGPRCAIQDALVQLRDLRNALAHALPTSHDVGTARPAYSLDDDDHG